MEIIVDFGIFYLSKLSQPHLCLSNDICRLVALSVGTKRCLILEVLVVGVIDAGEDFRFGTGRCVLVCAAQESSSCWCEVAGMRDDSNRGVQEVE